MKMNKNLLSKAIGLTLGTLAMNAHANLTSSATLTFSLGTQQVVACTYGTTPPPCLKAGYNITDIVGSYFSMDTNSNGVTANEKTPISSFNGIHIGSGQLASGSHTGSINGTESPNIDNPWTFFGGTGMHQTTSPVTVLSGAGTNSQTLDLSGWNVTWNGIPGIALTQIGAATINCVGGSSCSDTSSYTADAAFHVNGAGFTTVAYTLHLTGHVDNPTSAVPVPAAAWLLGSGLLGLAGISRRRKTEK